MKIDQFFSRVRQKLQNWSEGTLDHPKHAPTLIPVLAYLHLGHSTISCLIYFPMLHLSRNFHGHNNMYIELVGQPTTMAHKNVI